MYVRVINRAPELKLDPPTLDDPLLGIAFEMTDGIPTRGRTGASYLLRAANHFSLLTVCGAAREAVEALLVRVGDANRVASW
mgnify:CR=1 FL=1